MLMSMLNGAPAKVGRRGAVLPAQRHALPTVHCWQPIGVDQITQVR